MKLPPARLRPLRSRHPRRRGAALLLSLLVLFVLVAIVFQINVTVGTDARMARNDVGLTGMDLAIESAMLRVLDELKQDGEAAATGGGAGGMGAGLPGGGGGAGGGGAGGAEGGEEGGGGSAASDSREDGWGKPQQTSFDEMSVRLRILVQDEDSKFNVLAMLSEDEDVAEEAFERVVRILDLCREDTDSDIDRGEAERMARAMQEHMQRRADSEVPMTEMLTYDDERRDIGLPLTLREFEVLEPFDRSHFRDFREEDRTIVHSLGSYLTVWSALTTAGEAGAAGAGQAGAGGAAAAGAGGQGDEEGGEGGEPGITQNEDGTTTASAGGGGGRGTGGDLSQGPGELTGGSFGWSVNVNTAPAAVLKGLFDSRDVNPRFWDEVIRYRNEEEEQDDEDEEDVEPVFNERGEEVVPLQIFDEPKELGEIEGWLDLEGAARRDINDMILTQSQVFSIYITAIRTTGAEEGWVDADETLDEFENSQGNQLVRTVRAVYWRRQTGEEVVMTPVVRWEVLDYVPFEVLDFPEDDR